MLSFLSLIVGILVVELGDQGSEFVVHRVVVGVLVLVDVVAATLGSLGPTLLAVDIC